MTLRMGPSSRTDCTVELRPEMGMGEGLNSLYGRQRGRPPEITNVIGCGGGCWVAIFAAMAGAKHLRLFDSDTVELSNLNRLPYTTDALGKPKTTALAEFIRVLRPDIFIEEYPAVTEKLQYSLLDIGTSVLAIDHLDARREIEMYLSDKLGYSPIHVNFEGDKYKVSYGLWEEEQKAIMIDTGYANPNEQYVSVASIACATAVHLLMFGTYPEQLTQEIQNGKEEKEQK